MKSMGNGTRCTLIMDLDININGTSVARITLLTWVIGTNIYQCERK